MLKVLIGLVVSSTEGARVAVHEHDEARWGRTCESLEGRFRRQQAKLASREGNRALVGTITIMRTLRRANARKCAWTENGDVDTSEIAKVAHTCLQQSPCYAQSKAAIEAAQGLPDDEREQAMLDAMVMLFSEGEGCSTEVPEAPEINESDDEMEEEIDDATDEVMDGLVQEDSESSLIQKQENPVIAVVADLPVVAAASGIFWVATMFAGPMVFLGTVLLALVLGLLCHLVMHLLVRIFRYMRCRLFHRSCSEYAPSTWLKFIITGGCAVTAFIAAPFITGSTGALDSTFINIGH